MEAHTRELSSKKVTEAITAHLLLGASPHPLPCTFPSTLKQQMHGTAYPQQPFSEGKSWAGSKLHILICLIEKHLEIVNMAHCNPITTLFLSFFLTTKFHRSQKNTNFLVLCPEPGVQMIKARASQLRRLETTWNRTCTEQRAVPYLPGVIRGPILYSSRFSAH